MKIRKKPINVLKPIGDIDDIKSISKVIKSGWWGNGPLTKKLEGIFCQLTNSKYAVSTNSNTSALDMVIKAYNLQGKDILSPTISFATTGIVPLWNNCKSILCDVDENLNISSESIKKNLTKNTGAIVIVNMAGVPVDISKIRKFFKGLIIEDCAHSAYVKGAGEQGDLAIAISTSGKSKNIIEAIKVCRDKNIKVILLTGKNKFLYPKINKNPLGLTSDQR